MNSSTMADSRTLRNLAPVEPRSLIAPAIVLAGLVGFFGFPGTGGDALDHWFQGLFWDGKQWLIPHGHELGDALAYRGPKVLIIIWAVLLILAAIFARRVRMRALFFLACLALVPVISTQLRAVTHMATPLELKTYGGPFEHLLLFEAKPTGYPSHAFPAGHASGGFALMGLYWILGTRRWRGLALGLLVGSWMGLYQVARGEHFLSHTLATAALAWLLCASLALAMKRPLAREVSSTN
jgi:membrane-associated PAP2 superfamily phosphatase